MERNRSVDVSGVYSCGTKDVVVRTPEDLVANNISVSPDAVAATWGDEAAQRYQQARAANIAARSQRGAQPASNA